MTRIRPAFRAIWRLLAARRGVAATELALVTGVILILTLGMFDIGRWVWQKSVLQGAAAAGATFATAYPTQFSEICTTITDSISAWTDTTVSIAMTAPACPAIPDPVSASGGAICPTACIATGQQGVTMILTLSRPFAPLMVNAIAIPTQAHYALVIQ